MLFDAEREDLFRDLLVRRANAARLSGSAAAQFDAPQSLPRGSALRKVNELVRRRGEQTRKEAADKRFSARR